MADAWQYPGIADLPPLQGGPWSTIDEKGQPVEKPPGPSPAPAPSFPNDIVSGVNKGLGGLTTELLRSLGLSDKDPSNAPGFVEGVTGGVVAAKDDFFAGFDAWVEARAWYVVFALIAIAVLFFGISRII